MVKFCAISDGRDCLVYVSGLAVAGVTSLPGTFHGGTVARAENYI